MESVLEICEWLGGSWRRTSHDSLPNVLDVVDNLQRMKRGGGQRTITNHCIDDRGNAPSQSAKWRRSSW